MHVKNFIKQQIVMSALNVGGGERKLSELSAICDKFPVRGMENHNTVLFEALRELKNEGVVGYDNFKLRLPQDRHLKVGCSPATACLRPTMH